MITSTAESAYAAETVRIITVIRIITAIGSNESAVRLSGISVTTYKIIAYLLSGFTAARIGAVSHSS